MTPLSLSLLFLFPLVCSPSGIFDWHDAVLAQYEIQVEASPTPLIDQSSSWSVVLSSARGQRFVCSVPAVEVPDDVEEMKEEVLDMDKVSGVLGIAFQQRPCLHKTVGWWTYEMCFNTHAQQYHLNGKDVEGDVVSLGYLHTKHLSDTASKQQKYLSHEYTAGTPCELTGRPRTTEVRFFCDEGLGQEQAFLYRVDEPASCQYRLTVHVGSLCTLAPFLPPDRPAVPHNVVCRPLLSDDQATAFVRLQREQRTRSRQQKQRLLEEERRKAQRQYIEGRRAAAAARRRTKDGNGQAADSLVKHYRAAMEKIMKKQVQALKGDPDNFKIVDFDLNLFGSAQDSEKEGEEDEAEEDLERGDLWYYFHDSNWDKSDYPSIRAMPTAKLPAVDAFEGELSHLPDAHLDSDALKDHFDSALRDTDKDGLVSLQKTLSRLLDDLDAEDDRRVPAEQDASDVGEDEEETADDRRVKVRVRKVDPSKDHAMRRKVDSQAQKLEEQLMERLKKAGFDSKGHKVQVKVITGGYFDDDDQQFHILSAADSDQFSNLIVSLLGVGDSEQHQEKQRHDVMEQNYAFNWNAQHGRLPR